MYLLLSLRLKTVRRKARGSFKFHFRKNQVAGYKVVVENAGLLRIDLRHRRLKTVLHQINVCISLNLVEFSPHFNANDIRFSGVGTRAVIPRSAAIALRSTVSSERGFSVWVGLIDRDQDCP